MKPVLTPRLLAVAALVPQGAKLADIGTDHAYLPAWLLRTGTIPRAIASDLREGPLSRARETARQYGVEDQMEFRLCNGLSDISPEEADTIVIAGMGGETIASILDCAPWTKVGETLLLLQPMSSQEDLRRWLQQNHYHILREDIVREGSTLYTIMSVRGGEMPPLTEAEYLVGINTPDSWNRGAYLEQHMHRLRRRIEGMKRSSDELNLKKCETLETLYTELIKMRQEWEQWQKP